MFEQLGLIGCGLMGGSFALAAAAIEAATRPAHEAVRDRRPQPRPQTPPQP